MIRLLYYNVNRKFYGLNLKELFNLLHPIASLLVKVHPLQVDLVKST